MKHKHDIIKESKKYRLGGVCIYPLVIKDGKGVYLEDPSGKKYLDFNSQISTQNIGYCHPEIKEVIKEYSKKGLYKIAGSDFYSEASSILSEELIKICPSNMKKAFLVNSGAEAVENCMKLAYRKKGPFPGVSCKGAFHGRTLGALTYTASKLVQKKNFPELPHHTIEYCTKDEDSKIAELENLISAEGAPSFVIVEAVQGEGGYRPASKKFMKTLRKVSRENGFPLICDEVQSGMGRTGKWWAFEHYGIKPDIMSSAKSLNVGAAITSSKYDIKECGAISSTWGGGHLIDMMVGAKVIEIIKRDKLLKNAKRMGKYTMKRLSELQENNSKIVETRGLGLMIGVELATPKQSEDIVMEGYKKGLALLNCGKKSIRIAPPLIITEKEIDKGLEIFESCLKKV